MIIEGFNQSFTNVLACEVVLTCWNAITPSGTLLA